MKKPQASGRRPSKLGTRKNTTASGVNILPRELLGGSGFVPPSERINIALVGCGGQGRTNARALFKERDAQIIAIADPIEFMNLAPFYYKGFAGRLPVKAEIQNYYSRGKSKFKVACFEDFRSMLEKEKSIDAIVCSTPDHLHAYVCMQAMRLGKH